MVHTQKSELVDRYTYWLGLALCCEQIADFGVAAVVDGDDETLTKLCGTPWYIAPEILKGERYGKVGPCSCG